MPGNDKVFRTLKDLEKAIPKEIERLFHKLAISIHTSVTLATPVGDPGKWENPRNKPQGYVGGRARGNWQITKDTPTPLETGKIDKSGRPTISKANQFIKRIRLGSTIYIQNNVPYMIVLDEGRADGMQHSSQAPIGFIQKAVDAGVAGFNSERINL